MLGRRKSTPAPQRQATPEAEHPALAVEQDLAEARGILAAGETALADARLAYSAALDAGAIAAAMAANEALTKASIERDISARLVERLEAQHAEALEGARTAAEAAKRASIVQEAERAARDYRDAVEQLYPDMIRTARVLLRAWALAQLAREAAKGVGVDLPDPDAFRGVPGRAREILHREERSLWINPTGRMPFADDDQARVIEDVDGSGRLRGATHTFIATHRQPFEIATVVPGRVHQPADRLAEALRLPGLIANEVMGWKPIDDASARQVLAALDRLEAPQPAPAQPTPQVERRPLGPAVLVAREPARR